jgi:hypothetical protein
MKRNTAPFLSTGTSSTSNIAVFIAINYSRETGASESILVLQKADQGIDWTRD